MAIDWTKPMSQTYEFYEVDPGTWQDVRRLDQIQSCSFSRDYEADTLGSGSVSTTENLEEMYFRAYMIAKQNSNNYKVPLGTLLVQTPSEKFDGKNVSINLDAYTPLIELKETSPALGYSILKGNNILNMAYRLVCEHVRAPVIKPDVVNSKLLESDFVAESDDTWLSFISDLLAVNDYFLELNEMGEIFFAKYQDTPSLQPAWTYDDDNSSILLPSIELQRDLYGIPNVVEVIYSGDDANLYSKIVNDDPNSPISTVNRGREILHRDTSPSITGTPTQDMLDDYASKLLRSLSTLEYTVSYSHGYTPILIGKCVRLNYRKANIKDTKVKILTQSFDCSTGCTVSETALFTNKLWG